MLITARVRLLGLGLVATLIWYFGLWQWVIPVVRAAESCTASVSPSSVMTQTDTNFSFAVTNTGTGTVNYVKITAPSSNFTLENYGVPGWSVNASAQFAELTGGAVAAGATFNFSFHATSGLSEAAAADWQVSTNTGAGVVNCTGSLSTAIVGVADRTPPVMSNIAVTSITNTTAVVDWTTDEAASSLVQYGLTDEYGLEQSDGTLVTTHTVSLTGLTGNTTYYFAVWSTDGTGNSEVVYDNTLTTASVTSTGTSTTSSSTTTSTTTAAPTPVVVVLKDTVAPSALIETDLSEQYETAPQFAGRATDAGAVNAGVSSVEYSSDDGANWLPVDYLESPNARSTSFTFLPLLYEDGNYLIKVRARDNTGNVGISKTYTLVIDRLPPVLGGAIVSVGPVVLAPGTGGQIVTQAGVKQKFTLSLAGGVTEVKLKYAGETVELSENATTGLWSGEIVFLAMGTYQVKVEAKDGAENRLSQNLLSAAVLPRATINLKGKRVAGAVVTVYAYEPLTGTWEVWEGKNFGQKNPALSDENGEFGYVLPTGRYYLKVGGKTGIKGVSQIFELTGPTPMAVAIDLAGFRLWPEEFRMELAAWARGESEVGAVRVGELAPELLLPGTAGQVGTDQLLGKPGLISFVGMWLPSGIEQIGAVTGLSEIRRKQILVIGVQDSPERLEVLVERGGYGVNVGVDRDGVAASAYGAWYLPTHYLLNRRGEITEVVRGVLSPAEIEELLTRTD